MGDAGTNRETSRDHAVTALVPAAGTGSRLGLGPKAFVTVAGATLLQHTLTALADLVGEVLVALPRADVAAFRAQKPGLTVIAGGATRQATVRALLAGATSELVIVHDVARPFLTPAVVGRVLTAARRTGAATAALQPADTVVTASGYETIPREELRLVQTPQAFSRALLYEAHEQAHGAGYEGTDDASLVARLGRAVEIVPGSPLLSKLTRPEDLPLFTALHQLWLTELTGVTET